MNIIDFVFHITATVCPKVALMEGKKSKQMFLKLLADFHLESNKSFEVRWNLVKEVTETVLCSVCISTTVGHLQEK